MIELPEFNKISSGVTHMIVGIQVYDHPRVLSENATLACSIGSVARLSWVVHLAHHVGNALHVFGVTHLSGIGWLK